MYGNKLGVMVLAQLPRLRARARAEPQPPAGKSYIKSEAALPDMPALTENSSDIEIDTRIRMTGLSHAHSAGTATKGKVV